MSLQVYRWFAIAAVSVACGASAGCSGPMAVLSFLTGARARPAGSSAKAAPAPSASARNGAETQCRVDAMRICEEAAHDRPASFFPDAVKGKSAENPSNLMAFAAPFQIPGGTQLKVACYYRPPAMKVVYARAWVRTGQNDFADLDPQAGQVLNYGAPASSPLDRRSLDYLSRHGYCLRPQP